MHFRFSENMRNILDLAKQGDVDAITTIINHPLKPKNIVAKVILKDRLLKLMFEGLDVPNQTEMVQITTQEIKKINLDSIETIHFFGRQIGTSTPVWKELVVLESFSTTSTELPLDTIAANQSSSNNPKSSQKISVPSKDQLELITSVINKALSEKALTANIELNNQTLKIIIETKQFLDGQVTANDIYSALLAMNSSAFKSAELYKQRSSSAQPFLIKKMEFEEELPSANIEPQSIKCTTQEKVSTHHQNHNSVTKVPEMQKIKKTRRIIGLIIGSIIAGFVIIRLLERLSLVFTSPLGGFGLILALFSFWRAWSILGPLLQNFLCDE